VTVATQGKRTMTLRASTGHGQCRRDRRPSGTAPARACIVVKYVEDDAFMVTAYLTHKPKDGEDLWPAR